MNSLETQTLREGRTAGLALRLALAGMAALAVAGVLMWWRFGPVIFMDLLTAMQNCF